MRPQPRGKPMVVIGALTVVASMLAVLGIVIGIAVLTPEPKDPSTSAPVVSPGQSPHVAAGKVMLFPYVGGTAKPDGLSDSSAGGADNWGDCHVTDSSGAQLDVTGGNNLHIRRSGSEYAASGHFSAGRGGDYTIRCGNRPTMVIDSEFIRPRPEPEILTHVVAGIGLALLAESIGAVSLAIGLVQVRRSRRETEEFDLRAGSTWPR